MLAEYIEDELYRTFDGLYLMINWKADIFETMAKI
jgi:hypothetical protein